MGEETSYGLTGEIQAPDLNDMVYLRARYYAPVTGTFLSRDTWEGDVSNPLSLNKWSYANENPIRYTDPSGKCADGVTTAGCVAAAMVIGGVSGGLLGGLSSVVYAKYIYGLAMEGKCNECTRNFLIQYTEDKFISDVGAGGAVIGAIYGATAGLGPEIAYGAAASLGADAAMLANIGMISLGLAGVDDAVKRLQRNPNDDCAKIDLGLSIAAMAGSLGAGLSGYKAPTNPSIEVWNPSISGRSVLRNLIALSREGSSNGIREVPSVNALEWFFKIAEPSSIVEHPNPIWSSQGGLTGKIQGGGEIYYRPGSKSGGPAININDIPGVPNYKFHFPKE